MSIFNLKNTKTKDFFFVTAIVVGIVSLIGIIRSRYENIYLSDENVFLNEVQTDNSICSTPAAESYDFKSLRCHGADPISSIDTNRNNQYNILNDWRTPNNPNVYNISYQLIKQICYTDVAEIDTDNNSQTVFGGIRLYILPSINGNQSLLLVPSLIYNKNPTMPFRFNSAGSEGYKNVYKYCLIINRNLNEPIGEAEIAQLINHNGTGTLTSSLQRFQSYFLGRNLLITNIRSITNNVEDSNLKIELLTRGNIDECPAVNGFLLQSTNSSNSNPINLNTNTNKTYYCLYKADCDAQSPNGAGCVKPCPQYCPE